MKYFIIGFHCSGKQEIMNILEEKGIRCGKNFSNIESPSNRIYNSYNYTLYTSKDINEIFENDAYVFIKELDSKSGVNSYKYFEGLSKYEVDNNDVFVLSPDQLISIPMNAFKDDVCFVWLDNNKTDRFRRYKEEKREYNFSNREEVEKRDIETFVKSIYSFNNSSIIYFENEDPGRVAAVVYAIVKHPDLVEIFKENYH